MVTCAEERSSGVKALRSISSLRARAYGSHPASSVALLVLATVVAVAASLAFMLPVATPPNAVVVGTGYVTVPEMARAGLVLNLLGVVLLVVAAVVWLPVVWG
jgi:sodium-dependent dicarboxylate transporter 2/3/5